MKPQTCYFLFCPMVTTFRLFFSADLWRYEVSFSPFQERPRAKGAKKVYRMTTIFVAGSVKIWFHCFFSLLKHDIIYSTPWQCYRTYGLSICLHPRPLRLCIRGTLFVAGSSNAIPVFSLSSRSHFNVSLVWNSTDRGIYGLDLPTSSVIMGMRGQAALVWI